jgi:multidrug efflux system membrane fusion protein
MADGASRSMNDRPPPENNPTTRPAFSRPDPAGSLDPADPLAGPLQPARNSRRARFVAALVVLVAIAISAWLWQGHTVETQTKAKGRLDPNARPMPVAAEPVRQGTIDVYIGALGTVTAGNTVVVRSRVDGQLVRVTFDEGQMVKAGQQLAQIDPRPFEVQLEQANGQVAKDEAQLNNARVDLDRYRTLLAQDSIAKQQVDTQAALVRQLEGTIKADQAAVDNAKLQLSYARIVAPISGRVGLRQVDVGNMIHASDTNGLVTITQVQPIAVVFPVPEDNVRRVMRRMKSVPDIAVEAYDRDGKTKLATGKLTTIDNQIDPATGTIKLKAEFANENRELFPNQFVNMRMAVETHENATLVPSPAVQRGAPGTFVYRVNDDHTVKMLPVQVGAVNGETTEVTTDLAPGALVVTDGADKLRDGARVDVIDRNVAQQAPATTARDGAARAKGSGARRKGGG